MSSFEIHGKQVILKVKKSPFYVLFFLYLVTFLCVFLPLLGLAFLFLTGLELKFSLFIFLGVFALISFYMLRTSLWNTLGSEILEFREKEIIYEADYGWFKDAKKSYKIENPEFLMLKAGYDEDNLGVLLILENDVVIETVTKIPRLKLEALINKLETNFLNS
uniref:hypothetical protein n=1 Tax=Flavobacterium sp. TaxID=239 RepID=UPI00404AD8D2